MDIFLSVVMGVLLIIDLFTLKNYEKKIKVLTKENKELKKLQGVK